METLQKLCRYNAWANIRVFELCRGLDPALLSADAGGTLGSVLDTLKHLTGVEEGYLAMLRGQDRDEAFGSREAYLQRDFAWFLERLPVLDEDLSALLTQEGTVVLARELRFPWLNAPITGHDGLVQVLTHSAHHRAQVLSALGTRGIAVPDVDYLLMLAEEQAQQSPASR